MGHRLHFANAGALIADDVGVGKSRVIGGIIADQVLRNAAGLPGAADPRHHPQPPERGRPDRDLHRGDEGDVRPDPRATRACASRTSRRTGCRSAHAHNRADRGRGRFSVYNLDKLKGELIDWQPSLIIVDEAHELNNLKGARRPGPWSRCTRRCCRWGCTSST